MLYKLRVVSLLARSRYDEVMTPEAEQRLRSFAILVKQNEDRPPALPEMQALLADADGCLTGWGVQIPEVALVDAERLKIIGHMAGSVKRVVPPVAYERGIVVTHAAPLIAKSVGEMALGLIIAGLRCMVEHDAAFKQFGTRGDDRLPYSTNRGIAGSKVGIVGASMTGRELIRLLHAFGDDVAIAVHDPYLSEHGAGLLGVHQLELDELLATCDVVSLHAPVTDATRHMIGAREVALLKDGALLVNTARGALIDHAALLAELRTGRIKAALDVYLETLRAEEVAVSEYRQLPNVIITPGRAGPSAQVLKQMGAAIVDELARFFTGLPPRYQVTGERRATMA
jgi:phosphoglycerate dehydrogenase-like enzyme